MHINVNAMKCSLVTTLLMSCGTKLLWITWWWDVELFNPKMVRQYKYGHFFIDHLSHLETHVSN